MTNDKSGAAAAAIVEGRRAAANLAELHGRLESLFARSEPFEQAGKYMRALLGDVPRRLTPASTHLAIRVVAPSHGVR